MGSTRCQESVLALWNPQLVLLKYQNTKLPRVNLERSQESMVVFRVSVAITILEYLWPRVRARLLSPTTLGFHEGTTLPWSVCHTRPQLANSTSFSECEASLSTEKLPPLRQLCCGRSQVSLSLSFGYSACSRFLCSDICSPGACFSPRECIQDCRSRDAA